MAEILCIRGCSRGDLKPDCPLHGPFAPESPSDDWTAPDTDLEDEGGERSSTPNP